MELLIGPRRVSTWSLRPWLVLKRAGAAFTTRDARYATEEDRAALRKVSPSGFVPVLSVDGEQIWDSLAICEWAAERYPGLWPADATTRALARSACSEMHSGFATMRNLCGTAPDRPLVEAGIRFETPSDPALTRDLDRVVALLGQMRRRFAGDREWLFGDWSIADAFFTPVAARFRLYQIDPANHGDDGEVDAYLKRLLAQPDYLEWSAAA